MLIHGLVLVATLLGVPTDDRGNGGGASGIALPGTAVAGAVAYSTASALALTGAGSTGQLLMSNGTSAPAFGTLTFPSTSTINQLLYSSSANVVAGLATAASSVLITSAGGVPSLATDLPSGVTLGGAAIRTGTVPLNVGGTNAALTASNGGIFYSTASAGAILSGTATANQLLLSGASAAPAWSTATYPATTTINQLLYSSATNTVAGATTCNSGIWTTSSGGVPTCATTFTSASGFSQFDNNVVTYGGTGTHLFVRGDTSNDQAIFGVGASVGKAFEIVDSANYTADCTTGDATTPTLYVHSSTTCATTKLKDVAIWHDDTDGNVKAETGNLKLASASGSGVSINAGTAIKGHLNNSATLDFGNLAAVGCEDLTITVTGAADGDVVDIGVPNGSMVTGGWYTGWVSATNTVSIRFCVLTTGNPASGTFSASVWQH